MKENFGLHFYLGTATAGELSNLAKVPHSRTYDVLESLATKGFVLAQSTKPLRYMAIQPKEALERAKKKLKEDTEIATGRINKIQSSSILNDLEKIHKHGITLVEPGEFTGALKGRYALHQQLETMFKGAKSKIFMVTTPESLTELYPRHGELLKKAYKRGVKIRIAVPDKKGISIDMLKEFAEVRKIDKSLVDITGRLCVVDDSHVVLALTDDKDIHPTQDLSFWTQSEHVAGNIMGPMFDLLWEKLK